MDTEPLHPLSVLGDAPTLGNTPPSLQAPVQPGFSTLAVSKGHGTENDFVIMGPEYSDLPLTPALVRFLCDRRAGLGGDGLLRVARAEELLALGALTELPEGVEPDMWFMDYYNADGSVAEMCGNGIRVFGHFIRVNKLVTTEVFPVGTRAGVRELTLTDVTELEATVSVAMGSPKVLGVSTCTVGENRFAGLGVDVGNPHLACIVPDLTPDTLESLAVDRPIATDASFFPQGVNVEIATELSRFSQQSTASLGGVDQPLLGSLHMRVRERGAGETRSCGTGTVAAAVAALADAGIENGAVEVQVPGGSVVVTLQAGAATLTGPSRIVGAGYITVPEELV